jgi:hypothetical protein
VRARLDLEGGHSHWLRLQHDNTTPYHRSVVEGEVLSAGASYWLYFDVAFFGTNRFLYMEYADDYLKLDSEAREPITHMVTIRVWASRESDGCTVLPAVGRFRLESFDDPARGSFAPLFRRARL